MGRKWNAIIFTPRSILCAIRSLFVAEIETDRSSRRATRLRVDCRRCRRRAHLARVELDVQPKRLDERCKVWGALSGDFFSRFLISNDAAVEADHGPLSLFKRFYLQQTVAEAAVPPMALKKRPQSLAAPAAMAALVAAAFTAPGS